MQLSVPELETKNPLAWKHTRITCKMSSLEKSIQLNGKASMDFAGNSQDSLNPPSCITTTHSLKHHP